VVLEAGHCPHDEVPDQVNGALLEWLAGLPVGQAGGITPEAAPPAGAPAPAAVSGRTGA
jgi:hypothetical protein